MLDGMSYSIQRSRIENLHSREVDRQSPTGLIFLIFSLGLYFVYLFVLFKCVPILLCFLGQLSRLPYSFWR